jgi:diacylglycerol kinase (ATP)
MATIDLVYNPVAGSFSEKRLAELIRALGHHGFDVMPLPTTSEGAVLSGKADLVCVFGGDGTLRDTVQALGPSAGAVPICIARSGTVNLVARELGYPAQPDEFAARLAKAWARGPEGWVHSPLYKLGDMPIVSCLSIGPDSTAVAEVSGTLKRRIGRAAYAVALLRLLRNWPRNTMHITGILTDGEPFACEAEAAIVSHAALYAGPFRLSPRAALAVDSIELVTLRRSGRLGMLVFILAAILRLPLDRFGFAEIRSARRVAFDRCITPVQVDGDHMPDCAYAIEPSGMTLQYVV